MRNCFKIFFSNFHSLINTDSSPDPDPFGNIVPENLLNGSFDISESSGMTTTRVNGSYANSSNYQNISEGKDATQDFDISNI